MGLQVEITFEDWHGRAVYTTLEDVTIHVAGRSFDIPKGTRTDFMSIPAFMRGFVGVVTKRAIASLLHDYLLQSGAVSSEQADYYFRECLGELGMGWLERHAYWLAVRLNSIPKDLILKMIV